MPGHNAQSRRAVLQEAEAEALRVLLDTASSGPVGLVVDGEAGIGKTTFALHARDVAAARGFRVLLARGTPSEVTLAFAGLADLLTDIDEAVVDGLVRVQRDALNRILLRGHATELFLTVEMNLSKVYRKLGIRSRAQLHSRLHDARENPDSQPAHGR